MKLTESQLRKIVREELAKEAARTGVGGRVSGMEDELEVYAMGNPESSRHGGPEYIDVIVRRRGGSVEFVDALGPPGDPIKKPAFNRDYGDILARKIEQGKGERINMSQAEIMDRLDY